MLDCNGILELDSKAATRNALKQNYYLPIGAKDPNDKQPFSFQWSILSFVFSGTSFLCCKFVWKFIESNHLTFLSSKCQDSLLEPEKRGELATDIVSYINKCERGQNLMKKYVIANLISLGVMVGIFIWYLESVDYFSNPFSVNDFNKWTRADMEQRTDIMIKLFPRRLVFPYESTGNSGTLQRSGIVCIAVVNHVLEKLYVSAIIFLTLITSLQVVSILVSFFAITLFHITTKRNNKKIMGLRNFTYGQRLILALLYKNIDAHLWCAVLDVIEDTLPIV